MTASKSRYIVYCITSNRTLVDTDTSRSRSVHVTNDRNSSCRAFGCLDPQCELCQHSSARRCTSNFDRKYLVSDALKAKCGAAIRVELIDTKTGQSPAACPQQIRLDMVVIDGTQYDKYVEANPNQASSAAQIASDLEALAILRNNKVRSPRRAPARHCCSCTGHVQHKWATHYVVGAPLRAQTTALHGDCAVLHNSSFQMLSSTRCLQQNCGPCM